MATNTIFKHNDPSGTEHTLINDLVVESIQIVGFDVQYLPRTSNNVDTLFEDAETSSFDNAYTVEMYFGENSMTGFGGEGDLITRFGYEVRDTVQLVIAMSRFTSEITEASVNPQPTITRPREGDLVYFPFSTQLYEITFVEDQVPFFQLGKNFIYQLECSLFQYADEDLDTGVTAIDSIETALSYQVNVTLTDILSTPTAGMPVHQGTFGSETAKAEVVSYSSPIVRIMNIQGSLKTGETLKTTNLEVVLGTISSIEDQDTTLSQSTEIETLADSGIVDFTESNPFGEF